MRFTRIDFEGTNGRVSVEREPGRTLIRIDSIIRNAQPHEQLWKTWEVEIDIDDGTLFDIAMQVQARTNGGRGTNSDIEVYFRELQRFQY